MPWKCVNNTKSQQATQNLSVFAKKCVQQSIENMIAQVYSKDNIDLESKNICRCAITHTNLNNDNVRV